MRKILSIILCLFVLCMALCACGGDDSVSDMASDAVSDVVTEASEIFSGDNGEVEDGDGFIGNETTSSTNTTETDAEVFDSTDNTSENDGNNDTQTDARNNGMM